MSLAAQSNALGQLLSFKLCHQVPKLRFATDLGQRRHASIFRTTSGRALPIIEGTTTTGSDCACAVQLPNGLTIDRTRPLLNTAASYNQHVVVATGKSDWASRIEDEEGPGDTAKALKDMTKRTGEWFDPMYSTMISNSSFPVTSKPSTESFNDSSTTFNPTSRPQPRNQGNQVSTISTSTSIKLFPHFLHFPFVNYSSDHQTHLTSTYLGDQSTSTSSAPHPPPSFATPEPITKPTILICSHGTRDARCGILGPLLYEEFLQQNQPGTVELGMISHIGGHAFAGNVIVYIPPNYPLSSAAAEKVGETHTSPLAGMGIWYGRVEPRHVQQILEETVKKGNVIGELWRGGLDVGAIRDGGVEDWRARATGAKMLRVPSDIMEKDGMVVEENGFGEREMDTTQRLEMMGRRARECWERRQRGYA